MTDAELVSRIRSIDAGPIPVHHGNPFTVEYDHWPRATIEWRGCGKWAIVYAPDVLNKSGEFVYEPRPSCRSDAFTSRTRFDSISEAFEFWRRWEACIRERFAAGRVWGTTSWKPHDTRLLRKAVQGAKR